VFHVQAKEILKDAQLTDLFSDDRFGLPSLLVTLPHGKARTPEGYAKFLTSPQLTPFSYEFT
jgi:hypothetical protein